MNEIQLQVPTELSESQLYQDLTTFIKILKRIVNSMDAIITLLLKDQDCSYQVQKLREMLPEHNKLISRYNYSLQEGAAHFNTYYRFVCRLLQNITPYKNKINLSNPTVAVFGKFLTSAEQCIGSYKMQRNIGKIFKQIFSLTHSFCQSFDFVENDWFIKAIDEPTIRKKERERYQRETSNQYFQQNLSIRRMRLVSSESNFQRVMGGLNRQFTTLSCLDLNYSYYKQMFFMAHTQKDELYQQIYRRNYFILREIANYSKQFEEYLKRRDKPIISRKNRIKDSRELYGHSVFQNWSQEKGNLIGLKKTIDASQINSAGLNYSKMKQIPEFGDCIQEKLSKQEKMSHCRQMQKRKTSYQLKNIFLTINKIHANNNNVHPKHQVVYTTSNHSNNYREKFKNHALLKINKNSLRETKFAEPEEGLSRPVLEIKQYDFKNTKIKTETSVTIDDIIYRQRIQTNSSFTPKCNYYRKGVSEKKAIRVTQVHKTLKCSRIQNQSYMESDRQQIQVKLLNGDIQIITRE